jgi:hypothetical protein
MNEARPLKSVSDKSDVSDPFAILCLFRSEALAAPSDTSDGTATPCPTRPTEAKASRTEIVDGKQICPTRPTCPTDAEGGAPPAPLSRSASPARVDGLEPDAGAYLDFLRLHGAHTYGAMASELGWGATRAWRAEAKLRAAGLVVYREGKAVPSERREVLW